MREIHGSYARGVDCGLSRTGYNVFYKLACPSPEECSWLRICLARNDGLDECIYPYSKWSRGLNPLGRERWVASCHFHEWTASDFQTIRESALKSYSTQSDATLLD